MNPIVEFLNWIASLFAPADARDRIRSGVAVGSTGRRRRSTPASDVPNAATGGGGDGSILSDAAGGAKIGVAVIGGIKAVSTGAAALGLGSSVPPAAAAASTAAETGAVAAGEGGATAGGTTVGGVAGVAIPAIAIIGGYLITKAVTQDPRSQAWQAQMHAEYDFYPNDIALTNPYDGTINHFGNYKGPPPIEAAPMISSEFVSTGSPSTGIVRKV